MSAMRIFLRRVSACWTTRRPVREPVRRAARRSLRRLRPSRGRARSQAMPSASQRTALAPTDREAIFASDGDRARPAGWETSVATSGIGQNSGGQAGEGRVKNAILIAGPTASGKSALALDLAERTGGVIVNTDSMQGYSVLDVLTARPERSRTRPRAAFSLRPCPSRRTAYSTGAWLRDVMRLIDDGTLSDGRPIFVGGTGLYFRALAEGISEMPDIPQRVRDRWRYELKEQGRGQAAPHPAARGFGGRHELKPTDGQRIVRALEVLDASGRSILEWQAERGRPLIDRDSAQLPRHRAGPGGAGRAHRGAVRPHARAGRAGGGRSACGAWPRSGPAGDEGDRRARTCRRRWPAQSAFPKRSSAPRSQPGNMPSGRRPGFAISWARNGRDCAR